MLAYFSPPLSGHIVAQREREDKRREFNLSELAKISELFGKPIDYLIEKEGR